VVLTSTKNEDEANQLTTTLGKNGFKGEVLMSTNGYFVVVVPSVSKAEADEVRAKLISKRIAHEDAFISLGESLKK
jgi:cell division septation protein DedD